MGPISNQYISDQEIEQFLEIIFNHYGYDFREYSRAHIKRRILHWLHLQDIPTLQAAQEQIPQDIPLATALIRQFSICVTEMFRDPQFYLKFRQVAIPLLRTIPFIRIWNAGCASGEEVYSLAILLKEEGLYSRCRIYATDFNEMNLALARDGIYKNERMREYSINYRLSGGKEDFSTYYYSQYKAAIMHQNLKQNIVWANHNLVTDWVFNEFDLIICRNVMIYFTRPLRDKVFNLFVASLSPQGILCLGTKESLKFTLVQDQFSILSESEKIYKRKLMHHS
ncbi:protein-glutamate O-methyltransferase CheR [Rapidithrix thailandica]|uniref:Protein-glutamate O-methyltransferase CheR n=1 Tax=Rapidithrix thailandica TaxID=413964 RepID=A0AAW9S5R3_9BACT